MPVTQAPRDLMPSLVLSGRTYTDTCTHTHIDTCIHTHTDTCMNKVKKKSSLVVRSEAGEMPWRLRASAAQALNSVSWDYSQLLQPQLQGIQCSPTTSTSVHIQTAYMHRGTQHTHRHYKSLSLKCVKCSCGYP